MHRGAGPGQGRLSKLSGSVPIVTGSPRQSRQFRLGNAVGRLLGDPEVWDDTPARPRPALRGLVGLAVGAVAGLLGAFAVVPRPDPPPLEVRLPPAGEAPKLRVEKQVLYSAGLGGGPLLVARSGRLEEVKPDGTDRRVLAQNLRASAVVGPDRAGVLAALDSGVVVRVEANGTTRRLGPEDYAADGLAGAGRQLLACPDPAGQPADAGLLLDAAPAGPGRGWRASGGPWPSPGAPRCWSAGPASRRGCCWTRGGCGPRPARGRWSTAWP
jgi:hypothetical protein